MKVLDLHTFIDAGPDAGPGRLRRCYCIMSWIVES